MATSGSSTQLFQQVLWAKTYIEFSWKVISQSAENNTSTIEWKLDLYGVDGGYYEDLIPVGADTEYWEVSFDTETRPVIPYKGTVNLVLEKNERKTIANGTHTFKHNGNGERVFSYAFGLYNGAAFYQGFKQGSGTGILDPIPRPITVLNAPNFTDEENPTITLDNYTGNLVTSLQVGIFVSDTTNKVDYKEIDKNSTSYTFELTDAERAELRKGVKSGNSAIVRFSALTIIDGKYYFDSLPKTLTLVNYEPTLNPRVVATDTRTKELTGDTAGGTIIKYFSDVAFNTRAVANKEATIEYQTITCGSTILDDYTSNTGTIANVDSNTFYFSVTDSRGHTTRDAVVFSEDNGNFIPYVKLTNTIRQIIFTPNGDLTFIIGGKYFNGSFGAQNNTLEVEYSLTDENGNFVTNPDGSGWQVLGTVTPDTDDNGNYTFEHTISGLNHEMQYTLTVNAIDELTPVQTSTTVIAVKPLFDWGKSGFAHHTNVYLDNNKTLRSYQADGSDVQILGLNASNGTVLGWGGYDKSNGDTGVYGNNVRIHTRKNVYINGGILADFVVEQGTSNTWFYRKWNSGRVELYGYQNISNLRCDTALGALYRTAVVTPPSFPFNVNSPKLLATYESDGYGALLWTTTLTTTTKPGDYYLVRPLSSNGITGKVNFHVQGSWK